MMATTKHKKIEGGLSKLSRAQLDILRRLEAAPIPGEYLNDGAKRLVESLGELVADSNGLVAITNMGRAVVHAYELTPNAVTLRVNTIEQLVHDDEAAANRERSLFVDVLFAIACRSTDDFAREVASRAYAATAIEFRRG
jgi:hypothetical protein